MDRNDNPTRFAPASTAWQSAAAGSAAAAAAVDRVALLAGASGLVGRAILQGLLAGNPYRAVHTLGRRPLGLEHPNLTSHRVDFAALPKLPPVDDVYIALGTTIKVAGSRQAFRGVDFEAVLAVARAARAAGAQRLGVVSAMGADARSRVFYNRVKGEMEQAVSDLGYTTLVLVRPSLLLGDRAALSQPARTGEKLASTAMRWLGPLIPANYRAVRAEDVALALIRQLTQGLPGRYILLSGALQTH